MALHAVGLSYSVTEDFEEAINYAKESMHIYESLNEKRSQAFELQVLAQWYVAQKKPVKAVNCGQEALGLYRSLKSSLNESVALLITCEAMVENGRSRQAV